MIDFLKFAFGRENSTNTIAALIAVAIGVVLSFVLAWVVAAFNAG